MEEQDPVKRLQEKIWAGSIPLHISLSPDDCRKYDESHPYLIQVPRLSYLPFLLGRLHAFLAPALIDPKVPAHHGWFSFEGVPLKWQHPVGLLYDLYSGAEPVTLFDPDVKAGPDTNNDVLPWKLVVHFTDYPTELLIPLDAEGKIHHDSFINSVKEADYLRNGTAKAIMSLSKDDSTRLWESVQKHNLQLFNSVNNKMLNPPGGVALRHVPIKIYLPNEAVSEETIAEEGTRPGLKVVQSLLPPMLSPKEPQTLGTALRDVLPTLFPSRRLYIHAHAVLHGAVLPLNAPLHDLMQGAAYADGFLHIAVLMVG